MALAPLAEPTELGDLIGEELDPADKRAVSVLSIASDLVRAYIGWAEDPDPVPDVARSVALNVAARAWQNPAYAESDAVGEMQWRFGTQAPEGFYLSKSDKLMLNGLRRSSRPGLFTIETTRGEDYLDTVYVPTGPPPSGYPFPWYAADDPTVFP